MINHFLIGASLFLASFNAFSKEAYCTEFADENNKPIHKVCKAGDIIEVTKSQTLQYCDFSKQIINSPLRKDYYACQYLGYLREFRSRSDGSLSAFIIDEK